MAEKGRRFSEHSLCDEHGKGVMIILNRRFATPLPESYRLMTAYHIMVEHTAVKRVVVGSSPDRGAPYAAGAVRRQRDGAWEKPVNIRIYGLF